MVPQEIEHRMRLLGGALRNVHTFQARVVKLAMETGVWAARCHMIHLGGTTGIHSRKMASNECTGKLGRSGWKLMPIARRPYMGLPSSKRKTLLAQWNIAFPARAKTFMGGSLTREEGPARLFREEILRIKRAVDAARKKRSHRTQTERHAP